MVLSPDKISARSNAKLDIYQRHAWEAKVAVYTLKPLDVIQGPCIV